MGASGTMRATGTGRVREMGNGILASLDIGGQIAFFVATAAGVAYVYVWIVWRPRHLSHRRDHDCHSLGYPWLKERLR